jgi:alanyl-tRNA synthetase
VTPDYLRFDFPFDRGLTHDETDAVEDEVRRIIRDDRPVSIALMGMADAIEGGADAFFDEKYGETVRTIRVRDYSFELCGGTHCRASGEIGSFVLTGDRSIGSGMRRIEALTGDGADAHLRERAQLLDAVVDRLGAQSADTVLDRIAALETELREAKRRLREGGGGAPRAADLVAKAEEVAPGLRLVAVAGAWESIDTVKAVAKELRALLPSGVIALALDADEPQVFVTVSDDLVARGIAAGDLVRSAMPALDGKGGGRPEMAQGKGSRRDGLPDALAAMRTMLAAAAPSG